MTAIRVYLATLAVTTTAYVLTRPEPRPDCVHAAMLPRGEWVCGVSGTLDFREVKGGTLEHALDVAAMSDPPVAVIVTPEQRAASPLVSQALVMHGDATLEVFRHGEDLISVDVDDAPFDVEIFNTIPTPYNLRTFGDCSSGALTINSGTTTWTTPLQYSAVTITGTASLDVSRFGPLRVCGILDLSNAPASAVTAIAAASAGSAGATGGTGGAAGVVASTRVYSAINVGAGTAGAGANGGTAAGSAVTTAATGTGARLVLLFPVSGGDGGAGSGGAGGASGDRTEGGTSGVIDVFGSDPFLVGTVNSVVTGAPGTGGGGGGGDGTSGGGGGGAGLAGLHLVVAAAEISRGASTAAGAITAPGGAGGAGGTATAGQRGGGGGGAGGGGGVIHVIAGRLTGTQKSGAISCAGAAGGAGGDGIGAAGTGGDGGDGGPGGMAVVTDLAAGTTTRTTGSAGGTGGANSGTTGGTAGTGGACSADL